MWRKIEAVLIVFTLTALIAGSETGTLVFADAGVSITNLSDGEKVDLGKIDGVEAAAPGADKLILYIDGEWMAEAEQSEHTFSKSLLTLGTHKIQIKAFMGAEIAFSEAITVSFVNVLNTGGQEYAFEDYTGGLPTYLNGTGDFLTPGSLGGGRGTSLLLNMREGATSPWIETKFSAFTDGIHIESEVYFTQHDKDCFMRFKSSQSGATVSSGMVRFSKDNVISLYDNDTTVAASFVGETEKWYRIVADVDMANRRYDLYVYEEETLRASAQACTMASQMLTLEGIRYLGPYSTGDGTFMAVDNIKCAYIYETPLLQDIYSDGLSGGAVAPAATSINILLSKSVYAPTFTKTMVRVKNYLGEVKISEAAIAGGKLIRLEFSHPLISDTQYTISIDGALQIIDQFAIGTPLTAKFTTAMGETEVFSGEFEESDDGLSFSADIFNNAATDKTVHVVAVIRTQDDCRLMAFDTLTRAGVSKIFDYPLGAADAVSVYIVGDYALPTLLSKEIFSWNKEP